jgi:CubicO group peptidase (beta-lactamase class C family)
MFTSTVVLQLVGEGKVGLDAPIETYLPADTASAEHVNAVLDTALCTGD